MITAFNFISHAGSWGDTGKTIASSFYILAPFLNASLNPFLYYVRNKRVSAFKIYNYKGYANAINLFWVHVTTHYMPLPERSRRLDDMDLEWF